MFVSVNGVVIVFGVVFDVLVSVDVIVCFVMDVMVEKIIFVIVCLGV